METKTIQIRVSAEVAEQFGTAFEERQIKNKMCH
jgi:citrate lyase gamma subunit